MAVNPYYGTTPYLAPGCYMGGCGYAMQFLVDRINALGGQIVYGAKVTEFIKDNDGKNRWPARRMQRRWQLDCQRSCSLPHLRRLRGKPGHD